MMVIDRTGLEILPMVIILKKLFDISAAVFMLFGGAIPYVFQYREIFKIQDARGFSLKVCLALFVANILRILFWFGKHFKIVLLGQSIIMLICMLFMLEISVRMNRKRVRKNARHSIWHGEIVSHFWEWTDLSSYLMALTVFTVISSILTAIFIKSAIYIEVLGIAALLTEAVLGLPQLIRNCSRHSTKGMSVSMVLMWTIGDIGKLAYFLILEQPPQFWMCAILQITIDILILLQVYCYKSEPSTVTA